MDQYAAKVRKFESFINETLKVDLKKTLQRRDLVFQSIAEFVQLQQVIEEMIENKLTTEPLRTQVDLGCNFYVQAKVPDPARIFVNIGLGFHVEFTLPEALKFIYKKILHLNSSADMLSKEAAKIKAHIKLVLEGLREMQNISAEDTEPHKSVF